MSLLTIIGLFLFMFGLGMMTQHRKAILIMLLVLPCAIFFEPYIQNLFQLPFLPQNLLDSFIFNTIEGSAFCLGNLLKIRLEKGE